MGTHYGVRITNDAMHIRINYTAYSVLIAASNIVYKAAEGNRALLLPHS
jgi:hypothetical protein